MSLMSVSVDWQQAIKGLVLLLVVAFDVWNKKRTSIGGGAGADTDDTPPPPDDLLAEIERERTGSTAVAPTGGRT